MIPFTGFSFFYLLGLVLLPAVVLGLMGRSLREYGLFASLVMLTIIFAENGQLLSLIAFAAWQLLLMMSVSRLSQRGKVARWLPVLLAVLPLALVKIGEI